MRKFVLSTMIVCTLHSSNLFAEDAKITFMRGKASATLNGKVVDLAKGSSVSELTVIETEAKSVVKVLMPDNSQLTVGPKSSIKIEKFREEGSPSLISVASGMLRSSVPEQDSKDTKMLIKTRSAVMGVRGTELQTIFNPKNGVSTTITFKGDVAVTENDSNASTTDLTNKLNQSTKSVGDGQVITTDFKHSNKILSPTKLAPVQFNALKRNDTFIEGDKKSINKNKQIIPPGLNTKKASPKVISLTQALEVNDQKITHTDEIVDTVSFKASAPDNAPPIPEDAPLAGGYVDLLTGLYVSPPPGSTFDENAGVYVPNENVGRVNPETGEFMTPDNTTLNDNGDFVNTTTGEIVKDIPPVDPSKNNPETLLTSTLGDPVVEPKPIPRGLPIPNPGNCEPLCTPPPLPQEPIRTNVNLNIKVKLQ